jgi:hypothetical protein
MKCTNTGSSIETSWLSKNPKSLPWLLRRPPRAKGEKEGGTGVRSVAKSGRYARLRPDGRCACAIAALGGLNTPGRSLPTGGLQAIPAPVRRARVGASGAAGCAVPCGRQCVARCQCARSRACAAPDETRGVASCGVVLPNRRILEIEIRVETDTRQLLAGMTKTAQLTGQTAHMVRDVTIQPLSDADEVIHNPQLQHLKKTGQGRAGA